MSKKKYISGAKSYPNGISVTSSSYPDVSVKVFKDPEGKVHHVILPTNDYDLFSKSFLDDKAFDKTRKWFKTFCLLLVFFLAFFRMYNFLIIAFFFAMTTFRLVDFITIVHLLKHTEIGQKTARYHAAEHMAVNAYNKLHRLPTLDEIKKQSSFSKICGSIYYMKTAFIPPLILLYISVMLLIPTSKMEYIFTFLGAFLISYMFFASDIYAPFQALLVAPPGDEELNTAIDAIKGYELFEEVFDETEDYSALEGYFDHAKIDYDENKLVLSMDFDNELLGVDLIFELA